MEFADYLTPTHLEILRVLQQAQIVIKEDYKTCENDGKWDGWTHTKKDKNNPYDNTMLVMCTQGIKSRYNDWVTEINVTLSHESIHVAQACKSGDGYLRPLGFRKDVESEAFSVQTNPKEVLRILKKYCL